MMIRTLTLLICSCWTVATLAIFFVVAKNYNPGSYAAVVVFGVWDSLVYLAIAVGTWAFASSRRSAMVSLIGSLAIGGLSLSILFAVNRPFFTPPTPTMRVMNCAGPIFEILLPAAQWPIFGFFLATAILVERLGSRKPPVDTV